MRTITKKILSALTVLAVCITIIPHVSVSAEEVVTIKLTEANQKANEMELTDEQLMKAYLGNWSGYYNNNGSDYKMAVEMTEDKVCFILYRMNMETGLWELRSVYEDGWKFKGCEVYDGIVKDAEDYEYVTKTSEKVDTKTKALVFTTEYGHTFFVYKGYDALQKSTVLIVEGYDMNDTYFEGGAYVERNDLHVENPELHAKHDSEIASVEDALAYGLEAVKADTKQDGVKEDAKEEDTKKGDSQTEETKPDESAITDTEADESKKDDAKTEDSNQEDSKTEDSVKEDNKDNKEEKAYTLTKKGRKLYEGETVYIVQKGDCLWGIARKILGDGRLYKNLFTRNGDIVKKAELIHTGQEIIIPVIEGKKN